MFDTLIISMPQLLAGAVMTLLLSISSAVGATMIGIALALVQVYGGLLGRSLAEVYLYLMRGIPLLVLLFVMYYMLPYAGLDIDPLLGGIFVLALYFSAFMTEVFRAALLAVPRGQADAAKALGMFGYRTLVFIIAPQALRLAGPPYVNTCIMLVKSTSLVSIIGLSELTLVGRQIVERTLDAFQIFAGVALIYFAICFSLSCYGRYLEKRVSYAH